MDIHKLKHTSEQIESVLHMATDMVPSSYTSEFDLPQWNEEDSKRLNILQILSDAYSKIDTAISGVDLSVSEITELYSELKQIVDDMKTAVDGEIDLNEINQKVASIETQVVSNKEGIEGNTTEIGNLQLKSDEFSAKIAKNTEDIAVNTEKYSQVKQTVDDISFTVSEPIDGGTNRYVTLTLTIGGNEHTGVVMIDGNVDVSGQLSAEALYAALGDIARLKVDSLSTSRRIPKYLKGDTSDDNYIDIEGQNIVLRRAWTDGSTEQARDPLGALLYWEQNVAAATIGADDYPYVDGNRVFITTEVTDYPVRVYSYQSGDRLAIRFDEDNNYGPKMVWGDGASDGTAKGKGYIEKLGVSFDIYNLGTDNVKRGMFIGNEYVDIVGERQPTKMVASGDTITVTYEGGKTKTFRFSRGTDGKINSVTYDGHTVTLEGFD